MKNNSFKKQLSILHRGSSTEVYPFVINDLQQTVGAEITLRCSVKCRCDLCKQKFLRNLQAKDSNLFQSNSRESAVWLKKILDSLCLSGAKTLKLHLPDILFAQGEYLEIFQTNRKDGRIIKLTNSTSLKSLYLTTVRLRKEYKNLLEQAFNERMLEQIDPQFMHIKYFDKFVPPYFHDGATTQNLQQNKSHFKRYILHKNKKFEIQQIQQHKMNDKEPFCIVKYKDGNCQLFNQKEFEVYSLSLQSKLQDQLVYVQSYIKYKLEAQAIYYSQYSYGPKSIDEDVDRRAEREILVLIGGVSKFQAGYKDSQTYQDLCQQLMISKPRQYVNLMTYKIVHYLNMTSRIFIDHIKIKWIMNDIGNIYLQQVMEFAASDIPKRLIKYRLPPKDKVLQIYNQSHSFIKMYKQLGRRKAINTQIIKKSIEGKNYQQIMAMMNLTIQPQTDTEYKGQQLDANTLFAKSRRSFTWKKTQKQSSILAESQQKDQISIQRALIHTSKQHRSKTIVRKDKKNLSVNLEKWRNYGASNLKQKVNSKIGSYFTIKLPEEQIQNKHSAKSQRNSKINNGCRLRYGANEDMKHLFNQTISTHKSLKPSEKSTKAHIRSQLIDLPSQK